MQPNVLAGSCKAPSSSHEDHKMVLPHCFQYNQMLISASEKALVLF